MKDDKHYFLVKGDRYFFFMKVGAANVLLKLNFL